jgi:hypothetical protein
MTFTPASQVDAVDPSDKARISIRRTGQRSPTVDELAFHGRASQMQSRINRLLSGEKDKGKLYGYVDAIRSALKDALENDDGLATGAATLNAVRDTFIEDEGPSIRRRFLSYTLLHCVGLFVLAIFVASLVRANYETLEAISSACDIAFDAAWIAAGAAFGIMFFAFVNSLTITFDNVGRFDSTGLGPSYRLVFIAVVLTVLATLLLTDAVTIGLGTAHLNDFRGHSPVAFLLGVFGAYSDIPATRLISSVLDRAAERRTP